MYYAMHQRFAEQRIREALADTPVVLIVGPRRAGKTTLARKMQTQGRTYITLDDQGFLDAARNDPGGFIRGLDSAIIDEVQRAPELLLSIKQSIDEDYRPGRFLLTGSANLMTLPKVADSLAGRMETIELLPLAQAEIAGRLPTFIDTLFKGAFERISPAKRDEDLMQAVLAGGFPEAISRDQEKRRIAWARSYLKAVLVRDIREIAEIEKLTELPEFLDLLAQCSGRVVNYSKIGEGVGITYKTSQRYIALLEQLFLIARLPSWGARRLPRMVKAPKLHFLDSCLLCAAGGISAHRVAADRRLFGPLLESYVFSEVMKHIAVSDTPVSPFHFRNRLGHEVDIVLERADGMIAGIEVKAGATMRTSDFVGLRALQEAAGEQFAYGVALYDSEDFIPFGERLGAAPLSSLWR